MKQYFINKHKFFYYSAKISIIILSLLTIFCRGSSKLVNNYSSNMPVDVYVGGSVSSGAVYWKNGEMVQLSTKHSEVTSIAVKGNDIYAGGYYKKYIPGEYEAVDITVPGYWKNGEWVGLSVLDSNKGSAVKAMFINGDDVYACGYSTNRSGIRVYGYWKNKKWVGLPFSFNYSVNSIFVVNDDIYACGSMKRGNVLIPVFWKNGECVELSFLSDNKYGWANSIFVSNNDVYIYGSCKNSSGDLIVCYWKNGEIIPLLSSDPEYTLSATSIFISGKDIYIGGYRMYRYYTPFASVVAGYWKNNKWIALIPFDDKKNSEVSSIFVYGKDVYACGYSDNSDGDEIPGYWKNGEWVGFAEKGHYFPVSSIVVVPRPTGE